jgi:hypothetical protein
MARVLWSGIDAAARHFYDSPFSSGHACSSVPHGWRCNVRNSLRIGAVVLAVSTPLIGLSLFVAFDALRQVPSFYREAVDCDEVEQKKASNACLQQAAALASDLGKRGAWQSLFTAEQINGWLAVDLVKNYPELLESAVRDPRVAIRENEATIACRYQSGRAPGVYSLTFDVYLSAPNVIAVRIFKARLGVLPVPLGEVLEAISDAARRIDLPLEWRQNEGDPVALITIPARRDSQDRALELDTIQLREGEIVFAGHSADLTPKSPPSPKPAEINDATAQSEPESAAEPRLGKSDSKKNRQR